MTLNIKTGSGTGAGTTGGAASGFRQRLALFAAAALFIFAAFAGCGRIGTTEGAPEVTNSVAFSEQTTAAPATTAEATEAIVTEQLTDVEIDLELAQLAKGAVDDLPPVASVAGRAVTQPEYRFLLNMYKSGLLLNTGIEAGSDEDVNFWSKAAGNGKTRLDEARDMVLAELHQLKICEIIAESRGVALSEEDYANIDTDIRALEDRFDGKDNFDKMLNDEYGITLVQFYKFSEAASLRIKLFENEKESIAIDEKDIKEFYEQNVDLHGDRVRIGRILFHYEGGDLKSPRTEEETKKLAEDMLARLNAGEDLDELARQYSEAPGAAKDGGVRIAARADPFEPEELVAWAFGAAAGDTAVVETPFGCYAAKLFERITWTYEAARADIGNELKERVLADRIAAWLDDPAYAIAVNEDVINGIF